MADGSEGITARLQVPNTQSREADFVELYIELQAYLVESEFFSLLCSGSEEPVFSSSNTV
jgi:hypothetical protein